MEQTPQELWEEILRLVRVMKLQTTAVEKFSLAASKVIPLDQSCLPVDYVADAEILVALIGRLEEHGVRLS